MKRPIMTVLCLQALLLVGCVEKRSNDAPSEKQISPQELDANKSGTCTNNYKATRILFVVDNSGSNGLKDGSEQNGTKLIGTDPVRKGKSARGIVEAFTDRQNALYEMYTHTVELDKEASLANPDFLGTELGIASFPASESDTTNYKAIAGFGGSNAELKMQNIKELKYDAELRNKIWDALAFTHRPEGSTPYTTAMSAAHDYLVKEKQKDDPREDYLFLISDGLPTDEQPSKVVELRRALGNTHVYLMSVYRPGADLKTQNSEAYSTLKEAYEKKGWAQRAGFTDSPKSFDEYWNVLLALPQQIANQTIDVSDSSKLIAELNAALKVIRQCTSK